MSNLNPQQEIRASLCQQYLHAGQHEASQIIANVQALEDFIFGGQTKSVTTTTKDVEAKVIKSKETNTETKAEPPAETVEKVETEQTAETETTLYTNVEIRTALMGLAKEHGKEAVANILSAVGAATVPAIAESDYPKVMALIEAKQKEAA